MALSKEEIVIPADVPKARVETFARHYRDATHNTGRLVLFAGDQRIEHLNADFRGKGIAPEDNDPEHMWRIASETHLGVYATHLGAICRYAPTYPKVPLLVKLDAKTNLYKPKEAAVSRSFYDVDDVVKVKEDRKLRILGIGYTLYPGSEREAEMLTEAAQAVFKAHQAGMIAVLWIYPRGKFVPNERTQEVIAGAVGVGNFLGADFIKVNTPEKSGKPTPSLFEPIVEAAGNSQVVVSGGGSLAPLAFLKRLKATMKTGIQGAAVGRNIHQKSLTEAVNMCNSISAMVYENYSVEDAHKIAMGKKRYEPTHE